MEKKLLSAPCGIEFYKDIVSNCYYVDKTLFIKEVLEDKESKVKVFVRPRRFGKTLALTTVKAFFEKTEEDNSKYFVDKLIWKEEKYHSFQGKYPVVFLTLKDCVGLNFNSASSLLSMTISREFHRHYKFVKENLHEPDLLNQYNKYLGEKVSIAELKDSLHFLLSILKLVYGQKVVVLIDEYDAPIVYGYKNSYYEQIIDLFGGFFSSAFRTNDDNLMFALLTGVLDFSNEILSGLNNTKVFSVLDEKYSSNFGFTPIEVENIARYYQVEDKIREIKEWYKGYTFGKDIIYNPWTIMNYISNYNSPKQYWVDTADNSILGNQFSSAQLKEINDLYKLYKGDEVFVDIDTKGAYKSINNNEDSFFSFLLVTGYLTATDKINESGKRGVIIPNKEIKGCFRKEIFSGVLHHPYYGFRSFLSSLLNADKENIRTILNKNLKNLLVL